MIAITVRDNLGELRGAMILAMDTWSDWEPFFDAWGDSWRQSRREMFETAGRATDTPWPMYSRATGEAQYAAVKSKILGHRMSEADLLRWLGGQERLMPSMVSRDHEDAVDEKTASDITVGTSVPYAHNHDRGAGKGPTWAGSNPIPMRAILDFGTALERATADMGSRFAAAGVNSMGRAGLTTAEVYQLIAEGGL